MQASQFDIVLIGAGLSSRMNGVQKMLHSFCGETLLFYSLGTALNVSDVVLVIGHDSENVKKEAKRILRNGNFKHHLEIVYNPNFKRGQYTSTICGIEKLSGKKPFALSLGDMPFIKNTDYLNLYPELRNHDVLRPFVDGKPSHPVFFKAGMKDFFIAHKDYESVRKLLNDFKDELDVFNLEYTENKKIAVDFDSETDFNT